MALYRVIIGLYGGIIGDYALPGPPKTGKLIAQTFKASQEGTIIHIFEAQVSITGPNGPTNHSSIPCEAGCGRCKASFPRSPHGGEDGFRVWGLGGLRWAYLQLARNEGMDRYSSIYI